jgi:hypothetical protein
MIQAIKDDLVDPADVATVRSYIRDTGTDQSPIIFRFLALGKLKDRIALTTYREAGGTIADADFLTAYAKEYNTQKSLNERQEFRARIGDSGWIAREPEPKTFELYTLDDLLSGEFRVTYLIDGILVKGQPCICAGPQKVLKTTMLLEMALRLAAGADFLGRPCQKSRVLFMSGESGMPTLAETAKRIWATILPTPESYCFVLSPELPRFDGPLDSLRNLIEENQIEVLVIDPAYLAMSGADAGNMFQMGEQLGRISSLCTELSVTLILAHHTTKSAGREFSPLDLSDIAWSGFGEFARQWLLLSRRKPYEDGTGEHKLFLRAGGSAGHSQLLHLDVSEGVAPDRHWQIQVKSKSDTLLEDAEQRQREEDEHFPYVVDALKKSMEKPLPKTALLELVGIGKNNDRIFQRLLAENVIEAAEGYVAMLPRAKYQLVKGDENDADLDNA